MFSFIETRAFTKLVLEYLTDAEYAALQAALIADPEAGPVIPGSGGVRSYVGLPGVGANAAAIGSFTTCVVRVE